MSGGLDEAFRGSYFSTNKYIFKDRRITPENITKLKENEIFVFGSNTEGRHGKGAAKTSLKWGAIYGQGFGIQGQTYAIPTKNGNFKVLPINEIKPYVDNFIDYAGENQDKIFLVTEIGTGLAGLKHENIAPLFKNAKFLINVYLPEKFWKYII